MNRRGPWVCFHCGEVCRSEVSARRHFGNDEGARPACQIKAAEGGLVAALRDAEAEALRARAAVHDESAEGLKAWQAAEYRHAQALGSATLVGYEQGLRDRAGEVERLRRIVHRYGDKIAMANCHRSDWQIEIDEAMRFVADNPEDSL